MNNWAVCKNQDFRPKKLNVFFSGLRNRKVSEVLDILKFMPVNFGTFFSKLIKRTIHERNIKDEELKEYTLLVYSATGLRKRKIISAAHGNAFRCKSRRSNIYLDLVKNDGK